MCKFIALLEKQAVPGIVFFFEVIDQLQSSAPSLMEKWEAGDQIHFLLNLFHNHYAEGLG